MKLPAQLLLAVLTVSLASLTPVLPGESADNRPAEELVART